jgi:hypothetical protein
LIDVLGLPLERAMHLLEQEGYTVTALETRSKKGVEGGCDARVLRQKLSDETHITLLYAVFRTKPNDPNN